MIRLEVPARPEYILAIRLVVSAVAERGGFSIEDIEDLKVASAEACILLMDSAPETLDIRITAGEGLSLELKALGLARRGCQTLFRGRAQPVPAGGAGDQPRSGKKAVS